jgi:hypothetical protein
MASKLTQLAQQKTASDLQTMSRDSLNWLAKRIGEMRNPGSISAGITGEDFRHISKFRLGGLYFFCYDAKTKDKLPYWDKFPLVLALERYNDGFLGLNLHYLPLKYRVAFLDKLMDYAIQGDAGEILSMRVTYDILNASKRLKEFKPCVKRYLTGQIQSRMLAIQPNEWDIAAFLPVQNFVKAPAAKVWQESLEKI